MDKEADRVDVRDGRVFRVVVLPEVRPGKRRKGMMTAKAARAIAITGKSRTTCCVRCGRRVPWRAIARKKKGPVCGECVQRQWEHG